MTGDVHRSHQFSIPGRYDRISEVCDFVAGGALEAGFEEDDIFRIQLACDEACTNVIEHAYGAEDVGDIRVAWQYNSEKFTIIIHDNGHAFDPDNVPRPVVPTDPDDLDKLKIGGLGMHFMRTLMDSVRFDLSADGTNRLIMVKHRPKDSEQ